MTISTNRIAVIGAGSVGSTIAYCLLNGKVAGEILMVDIDEKRRDAEVLDLQDGASDDVHVRSGTFEEAGQCEIIAITAGAKQRPGETRLDLIDRNHKILKSVLESIKPKSSAVLIIIANPCDVLTYFAQQLSGLPRRQVIGSGTFLDSQRLRNSLAGKLHVAESAIHAYVLGEHGDSQFVAWSTATVSNTPLNDLLKDVKDFKKDDCAAFVRDKAQSIISAKGSTYYGIGTCVKSLCQSIFLDSLQVRPISHFIEEMGVCMSLPCVIGREGYVRTMMPKLDQQEMAKLKASAESLKKIISMYE